MREMVQKMAGIEKSLRRLLINFANCMTVFLKVIFKVDFEKISRWQKNHKKLPSMQSEINRLLYTLFQYWPFVDERDCSENGRYWDLWGNHRRSVGSYVWWGTTQTRGITLWSLLPGIILVAMLCHAIAMKLMSWVMALTCFSFSSDFVICWKLCKQLGSGSGPTNVGLIWIQTVWHSDGILERFLSTKEKSTDKKACKITQPAKC